MAVGINEFRVHAINAEANIKKYSLKEWELYVDKVLSPMIIEFPDILSEDVYVNILVNKYELYYQGKRFCRSDPAPRRILLDIYDQ